MNMLVFSIALCAIVYMSHAAENSQQDQQNLEFAICPESHPYAFAQGKVSLL
jgi:hypothetical protein